MEQLQLFAQEGHNIEVLDEQVVVRLILSGVYPFMDKHGRFKYLILEPGKITGTKQYDNFKKHFTRELVYLGEGQLSEEQKKQLDRFGMRKDGDPVITEVWTGKPYREKTWWDDLYTDANGNNFSDADPGL